MVQLVMHIVPSGDVLTLSREYSYSFGTLNTIVSMAKFTYYHQECDCKWVRRALGGSVIRLDIPRDTVSIYCNIKSARGHTSIHLTLWESRAQYKRWNQKSCKPCDRTSHLIDRFHSAERKTRSIQPKTMHTPMKKTEQDMKVGLSTRFQPMMKPSMN